VKTASNGRSLPCFPVCQKPFPVPWTPPDIPGDVPARFRAYRRAGSCGIVPPLAHAFITAGNLPERTNWLMLQILKPRIPLELPAGIRWWAVLAPSIGLRSVTP